MEMNEHLDSNLKAEEISDQIIQDAGQMARNVVTRAAEAAAKLARESEERNVRALSNALREVFGDNEQAGRFVDVSRIPLICANINAIHKNIEKINDNLENKFVNKDQFWPVKTLVYSTTGIILVGVIGAILALVIHK
jgi:uncharacterized protein (UPF0147 family)